MQRLIRIFTTRAFVVTLYSIVTVSGLAQTASQPPLFFREGWNMKKTTPGVFSLTQELVGNPNLEVKIYGHGAYSPGRDTETTVNVTVRQPLANDDESTNFVWTGMAEGNWAVTLKHKDNYVDLTRPQAKIRWRSFQDGSFQVLRPVLKLADGTYVIGVQGSGTTADYEVTDLLIADMRWVEFDAVRVLDRGNEKSTFGVTTPDLSRVDEIGFTTLSRGGGHGVGASAHVDWIEVYGVPVSRSGQPARR
jgi:hypothetical protein